MKNKYTIDGDIVRIKLKTPERLRGEYSDYLEAIIDLPDLEKLLAVNCTWYPNPAKAPKGKFYVMTKMRWRPESQVFRTVMLHRFLIGKPTYEVHHKDNDGLNNRRKNIQDVTHIINMRAQFGPRDWGAYEANKKSKEQRIAVFKKLVDIGKQIQEFKGLTRTQLFKIRTKVLPRSTTARMYWSKVCLEMPELFRMEHRSEPWVHGPILTEKYYARKRPNA